MWCVAAVCGARWCARLMELMLCDGCLCCAMCVVIDMASWLYVPACAVIVCNMMSRVLTCGYCSVM